MEITVVVVAVLALVALVVALRRSGHPEATSGHADQPRVQPTSEGGAGPGIDAGNE